MGIDRALVRPKNNGTQNVFVRDVLGSKADTAAAGAVTSTDTMMAYVKQLVTNVLSDSAVVGALADAAASGAVTEVDTVMAYIKQLVTEGIARDLALGVIDGFFDVPTADVATNATMRDVVGNKTDAAASGAVSAVESVMAYVKQVVTDLIVLDEFHDVPAADNVLNAQINEVIGNKEDAAASGAVTTTDTLVAYIKQLVTELAVVDEFHDVPAADNVLNAQINEVIGNKEDAAATGAVTTTDTVMAYIKQLVTDAIAATAAIAVIDEFHDVPAANNVLNAQINEVLGNKEDSAVWEGLTTTQTLVAMVKGLSRKVARTTVLSAAAADMTGTPTIFTITLGSIEVRNLHFKIITALPAGANTLRFQYTPSGGGAATFLCAATDTASAAADQLFTVDGVLATGLVKNAGVGISIAADRVGMPIRLAAGTIQAVWSAGPPASGAAIYELQWEPLTAGATVA